VSDDKIKNIAKMLCANTPPDIIDEMERKIAERSPFSCLPTAEEAGKALLRAASNPGLPKYTEEQYKQVISCPDEIEYIEPHSDQGELKKAIEQLREEIFKALGVKRAVEYLADKLNR